MFGLFNKKVDIHSIAIKSFGWPKTKEDEHITQWINPENTIAISVNFFNIPPDMPTAKDVDVLRDFYRSRVSAGNGGIITVDVSQLNHIPVVKTLFKFPQEERGITYITALTFLFKTCSFVVKVQAAETGATGMREAFLGNKLMAGKSMEEILSGWSSDPYDKAFKGEIMMNQSEEEQYDAQFPEHHLTKARQILTQIEKSIQWKPVINKLEPFEY